MTGGDAAAQVLPLIVRDAGGAVLEVVRCSEKGFAKSLERGELWHIHPETGRLLPLREGGVGFLSLSRGAGWYEAVVTDAGPERAGTGGAPAAAETNANTGTDPDAGGFLGELEAVVRTRKREMPEGSYTTHLFSKGNEKIRKKLGEEAVELLLARERGEIIYEASDLLYHLLVLLADEGITFSELEAELRRRHGGGVGPGTGTA